MSDDGDTCKFGHTMENIVGGIPGEVKKNIEKGSISGLDQLRDAIGAGPMSLTAACGDTYKIVKVTAEGQGVPRAAILDAADTLDDDLDYNSEKVREEIFISPQSNLHGEYMQRKQQAEQNIKETNRNLSQLVKQKHMLEHDIRKLRTRVENMRSEDETTIKGDFIELVDGAGAAGQQGGDEASLKFYRDNNIYPSIVADFQEMRGLDDLEEPDDSKYDNPRLNDIPNNEKAILKKKYAMYEKWKDLYGSEIQRKLKELKGQLKNIERSIEETKDWMEPYVRDAIMINELDQDVADEMSTYFTFKGSSTQFRKMEFISYKPLKTDEHHELEVIEDEDEATHFHVIQMFAIHVNIAGFEQPQSPVQGPSVGKIQFRPLIVCKHVFDNIFREKINEQADKFEQVMNDYRGDLESEAGKKLQVARLEHEDELSVRELREEVIEKLNKDADEDEEKSVPLEYSSTIRRIEDGIDQPEVLEKNYGEEVLEATEEVLDLEDWREEADEGPDEEMYRGITRKLKEFTGQVDDFKIHNIDKEKEIFKEHIKFDFYYDYKLGLGLFTMK